jgi:hypothetical protein
MGNLVHVTFLLWRSDFRRKGRIATNILFSYMGKTGDCNASGRSLSLNSSKPRWKSSTISSFENPGMVVKII